MRIDPVIDVSENVRQYSAYQLYRGRPCIAYGETRQEAIQELEKLVGGVQIRAELRIVR